MFQQNYRLIVIEKEKVPLAADPNIAHNYFWLSLAVVLVIVAVVFLWVYVTNCQKYRKRIRLLDPGGGEYRGWNVRQLKRTVENLELRLAGV